MTQVFNDLRYALRLLMRRPGLSITAVLTAALGIGMTTAMFSVANGVVLRPLPFAESERFVYPGVCGDDRTPFFATSKPDFIDWRRPSSTRESSPFRRQRIVPRHALPYSYAVMLGEIGGRRGVARLFRRTGRPATHAAITLDPDLGGRPSTATKSND